MAYLAGRTLGQYHILDEIGKSGVATVYRAQSVTSENLVALQALPAYLTEGATFPVRFMNALGAVTQMEHPHILPVIDYGEWEGVYCVVTPFIPTGDLARWMRQVRQANLEDVANVLDQIASGLDHAHRHGVVHGDVRPGNLLVGADGNMLMTGFVIGRLAARPAEVPGGLLIGYPEYMAPEEGLTATITPATDIYELSVTLFQMITGALPFRAETPQQYVYLHINRAPPPPSSLRAGLPPAVDEVLAMGLAKKPAQRFASAGEMAVALREALGVIPEAAPEAKPPAEYRPQTRLLKGAPRDQMLGVPAPGEQAEPPPERAFPWLILVALLAVLVVACLAVGWFVVRPRVIPLLTGQATATPTPPHVVAVPTIALPGGEELPAAAQPSGGDLPTPTGAPVVLPTVTGGLSAPFDSVTTLPPETLTALPSATAIVVGLPTNTPLSADTSVPPTNTPVPPTNTPPPTAAPPPNPIAYTAGWNIFTIGANGSNNRQITNTGQDYGPTWSPDRARLAFYSSRTGNMEIFVINVDGSGLSQITNDPAFDQQPAWNWSGNILAFASDRDGGDFDIYTMSAGGGGATRVTTDPAADDGPSWSPSGVYIVFVSTRDGGDQDIFTINQDGSELSQLTSNASRDTAPAWSPDGSRIAFVSNRDGADDIYVMDTLGGSVVRLTSVGNAQAPAWSIDGSLIIFSSGGDLYVVGAGGGAAQPFYTGPSLDADPAWAR